MGATYSFEAQLSNEEWVLRRNLQTLIVNNVQCTSHLQRSCYSIFLIDVEPRRPIFTNRIVCFLKKQMNK